MTTAYEDRPNPGLRGTWGAGPQSAGTTTLLRHHLAVLAVGELIRTDPIVQSLLRDGAGPQS